MRVVGVLVLLAAVASADAVKTYRSALGKLKTQDRKYWSGFRKQFNRALVESEKPFAANDPEAVRDFSALRDLFGTYEALQKRCGAEDLALAESGAPKAFDELLKRFFALCKRIDQAEADIAKAKPRDRYVFDPAPGVLREGLQRRLELMVRALSKAPVAEASWGQAVKLDKKKSLVRRVALIDSAGLRSDEASKTFLTARLGEKLAALRIAALDGLIGRPGQEALAPLLKDQSGAVRRALLEAVLRRGLEMPLWIGPLVEHHAAATGVERSLAVSALGGLAGQRFGDDAERWKEWFLEYRKEIEGGGFKRGQVEVEEVKPKAPEGEYEFFGVKSTSGACVFLVEGAYWILTPADWEVRRKKESYDWYGTHRRWREQHKSQQDMVIEQFDKALDRMGKEVRWALAVMHGDFTTDAGKGLQTPKPKDVGRERKRLVKIAPSGWNSPVGGLRDAAAIDPDVDTIFLYSTGILRGGRYFTPELTIGAFTRFNRFRRVMVHALRYDNGKEPSETLMKGLADASGGTYRWVSGK
ncbi:MAG: HEAT repeat domain-containing protein [Planctomycetota bacterium]